MFLSCPLNSGYFCFLISSKKLINSVPLLKIRLFENSTRLPLSHKIFLKKNVCRLPYMIPLKPFEFFSLKINVFFVYYPYMQYSS